MIRVLIVDDSVVFRSQITASLSGIPGLEVVGTASNGKIAIDKLKQNSIDLITLDMEMPEMDGMETLREIRKHGFKVKVIVFSSQTIKGAEKALLALKEGAHDVVAKPGGSGMNFEVASQAISESLVPKILQFTQINPEVKQKVSEKKKKNITEFLPKVIVIASSTGGPTALELFFSKIKKPFSVPVLIVQHMPPVFTQILAKRLSEISGLNIKEAENNEIIQNGVVYIAPGDYHMLVSNNEGAIKIKLNQEPQRNSVRPAADILFESAAQIYKENCLGVIFTGMGSDGAIGSDLIKKNNGFVVIQDKESCVVFGMPGAVYEENNFDYMGNPEKIASLLVEKNESIG